MQPEFVEVIYCDYAVTRVERFERDVGEQIAVETGDTRALEEPSQRSRDPGGESSRNQAALDRTILALTATFVACYVVFTLYPVAGPYYQYPRPAAWFLDNPTARLVYGTLSTGSSYGAAFPSSHVAAAVVALGTTWQGSRRAGLAAARRPRQRNPA